MSAWQHMWGLITKFLLSSLLIWLCRDYDAHFTQSCAEFRQQQHRSINASQPQQLVLCPRNLAYISLRAESVPFGILQQIPLPHFSGGLEHFGKNVFLMRPIWCSRCYLGYSKRRYSCTSQRKQISNVSTRTCKKLRKVGQHPFPPIISA